jgi:hypothetical protein
MPPVAAGDARREPIADGTMADDGRTDAIPADRLSIEKRADGTIVVAVAAAGPRAAALPEARFSVREGDPQYAYWMRRLDAIPKPRAGA